MRINYDGLVNAPSEQVAKASVELLDRIQNYPPHIQAASAAVAFLLICEARRVNPQDVFIAVKNILSDSIHGERPEFRAARLYVEHELAS